MKAANDMYFVLQKQIWQISCIELIIKGDIFCSLCLRIVGCPMRGLCVKIRLDEIDFAAVVTSVTGSIWSAAAVYEPIYFTSVDSGKTWRLVRCGA
jgi:hypothetical protein